MAEPMDPTQENLPLDAQPTAKLAPVAVPSAPDAAADEGTAPIGLPPDAAAQPEEGGPDEPPASARRRPRVRTWHVVAAVTALVLAAVIAGAALFMWDRWYRYDDGADIQGTWYAVGTDAPITITGDAIEFTPDTTYSYSLDENTKSLSFSLGNLDGQAHYVFADDRNVLVIFDGSDYSRWGTAGDDLVRLLMDVSEVSAGRAVHLPEGEGVIALSRTPFYDLHGAQPEAPVAEDGSSPSAAEGGEGAGSGGSSGDAAQAAGDEPSGTDVFGDVSDL